MKKLKGENPNTPEYWDAVYEREIKNGRSRINLWRFGLMENLIDKNNKVLEVGCGRGEFYDYLLTKRSDVDYTGIDISKVAIDNHKARQKLVFDGKKIPFPDKTFDRVISIEVMEHLDNPQEMASEMRRVLKDDGLIIGTTPFENKIKSTEHIWSFELEDIEEMFGKGSYIEKDHIVIIGK